MTDDARPPRRPKPLVVEVRDMTNPEHNPALRDAIAHVRAGKYRRQSRTDFDVFRVFR